MATQSDIEVLISWINDPKMPIWWKYCVDMLLQNQVLTPVQREIMTKLAKKEAEFNIDDINIADYNIDIQAHGIIKENDIIKLSSLSEASNIAALDSNQRLPFAQNGLTIIYGDNGSGKTSYCRVLKNCCLTRGAKGDVRGNILRPSNDLSQLKVEYTKNNTPATILWNKDCNCSDLKSIRVFDSTSALHYIENDDVVAYKLPAISVLNNLSIECQTIENLATEERTKASEAIQLPKLQENTSGFDFISKLSYETKIEELDKFVFTEEDKQKLIRVTRELSKLKNESSENIKRELSAKKSRFSIVYDFFSRNLACVGEDKIDENLKLRNDYNEQLEVVRVSREEAFKDVPLKSASSNAWKKLWTEAVAFSQKENIGFPPNTNELCPLCMQKIDSATEPLLKRLNTYINNSLESQLESLKCQFVILQKEYTNINTDLSPYDATINEIITELPELKSEKFDNEFSILLQSIKKRKEFLETPLDEKLEKGTLSSISNACTIKLKSIIDDLTDKINKLTDDDCRVKLIEEQQKLCDELYATQQICSFKENIKNEVKRLKQNHCLDNLKKTTSTRKITDLAKSINEQQFLAKIKAVFEDELNFMGFSYYNVQFGSKGQKGDFLWGLRLENSSSVNTIASEGEQKCIALACILAELKADGRKSGIVFDDPITSLDHKWREKIAERLTNESKDRQVIIFTHDLAFLVLMQEKAKSLSQQDLYLISLTRKKSNTGIVDSNPPWDGMNVRKRVSSLSAELEQLKKIEKNATESEYHNAGKIFFSKMRETWEKLVEEQLLNGVVTRFSRGISTKPLRKVVGDITQDDYDIIEKHMTLCSTHMIGHDNASGFQVQFPSISDVCNLFNELNKYHTDLNKRRQ